MSQQHPRIEANIPMRGVTGRGSDPDSVAGLIRALAQSPIGSSIFFFATETNPQTIYNTAINQAGSGWYRCRKRVEHGKDGWRVWKIKDATLKVLRT